MTFLRIKYTVVIAIFCFAVFFTLLTPVRDNDFFWHLATGKWIAEHRELPQSDPFAYTTPKAQGDSYRAKIVLTQYWLANLLQYGVFSVVGFNGIIALRALLVILTFLVLVIHMRKKGLNVISAVLLLVPLWYVFFTYRGDRPNQMTFLFAALFMFLADALKRGEKKGYLLPFVLLIWANMHGGFLLGVAIVLIMGVTELFRKVFRPGYPLNRKFVSVLLLTLCAGCANPNGYTILYSMLFEATPYYYATIAEANSPLAYARIGHQLPLWMLGIPIILVVWYFASRIYFRSTGFIDTMLNLCDELLIVFFLAVMSCTAIRYIPLFVLVATPVVAPVFAGKFQHMLLKLSGYFIPEMLLVTVSIWWIYGAYASTVLTHPPVDPFFPEDAVRFIKTNNMRGRFYNAHDWGGYLIWEFYPEKFVFIDGRSLSLDIYGYSNVIIDGDLGLRPGSPSYKTILDFYSVRHIIIPPNNISGGMYSLLQRLVNDPSWRLVFIGGSSLIFSQDQIGPSYNKTLCYNLALANAFEFMSMEPDLPFSYLTVAQANIFLGRPQSALKGLEDALQRRPALRGGPVEEALKSLRKNRQLPAGVR